MKLVINVNLILKLLVICYMVLQIIPSLENRKISKVVKHTKFHSNKKIYTEVLANTRTNYFSNSPFISSKAQPKWMQGLNQNLLISKISIPGTHDSGAFDLPDSYAIVKAHGVTQAWQIMDQLNAGIRYLDIRLGDDGNIYHSIYKTPITFTQVLNDLKQFLKTNPSEAIIMRVKNEKDDWFGDSTEEAFEKIVRPFRSIFVFKSTIPTLKQIKGKVWPILDDLFYTNAINWNNEKIVKQDNFRLNFYNFGTIKKKQAIIDFHNNSSKNNNGSNLTINHCSANGSFINTTVQTIAKTTNEAIAQMEGHTGIVVFDFPSEDAIKNVIDRNPKTKKIRKRII